MSSRSAVSKGFIPELDGLRGVAILLVMVHRFWPRSGVGITADAAGAGWIGVDLFFVISGFLIAGILLDTRGEQGYFRNFYARRVLRIFPLYYLFVGGVLLAFWGNPAFRDHAGSPLWYLGFLGNVPEGLLGHDVPYWLAPVWSLAIEEQFYLTFPLLVYFLDRRRLTIVLIAMFAAAPLIRLATMLAAPEQERVQYLFTLCRIDTLAIGCLLAVVARAIDLERHRTRAIQFASGMVLAAAAIGLISGLDRTTPFGRVAGYSVVAVGCAGVIALVMLARGTRATSPLRWEWLRYFGKLCFGLYLLHRPADTLVSAAAAHVGFDRALWLLPLKVAVALGLAMASWYAIERPFLRLKDRFASAHHPAAGALTPAPARSPSGFIRNALRSLGVLLVIALLSSCRNGGGAGSDASLADDAVGFPIDALPGDGAPDVDASIDAPPLPPDAPPPPSPSVVIYPENRRHSPITPAIAARLQVIASAAARDARVFAKVGDSNTAATPFLHCFDGGPVDLGSNTALAPTIDYFQQGNAAGNSPFVRASLAAANGWTAREAITGTPHPFAREVTAINPRTAMVMYGTNETRSGRTLDELGSDLWTLVDDAIARGVVPVLSTVPPINGLPSVDARIPTVNRVIRAIAQGRQIPLIDLHRDLGALSNRGLGPDGIHLTTASGGGCILSAAGLGSGYNMRNLVTIEALARVLAALGDTASDASASLRVGAGTATDPYVGAPPFVDLANTAGGTSGFASYACGGAAQNGREVVYRIDLTSAATITASLVDRGAVDSNVYILTGVAAPTSCVASGDTSATASVGPGSVFIVVDSASTATEGEYVLVVER